MPVADLRPRPQVQSGGAEKPHGCVRACPTARPYRFPGCVPGLVGETEVVRDLAREFPRACRADVLADDLA